MTVLCRRSPSGFMDEFYEKCFFCGYTPTLSGTEESSRRRRIPKFTVGGKTATNALIVLCLTGMLLFAVLQVPVPQRVFAFETSVGSYVQVLQAVRVINFTLTRFSLNYSEGQVKLNVSADYVSLKSSSVGVNVTLYSFVLGSVRIHYRDATKILDMGLSSLTLNVEVNFVELTAAIEGITSLPLWMAIANKLSGF